MSMKILLIDDDEAYGKILKEIFHQSGIECHVAHNTKEGWKIDID